VIAGQLLLVVTPDSGSGGRWFDSSSRNFWLANSRKSSGWMRGLSRKQVSALGGLWVRVPRLPPWHLRVRDRAIPWSSGNDSWPTPRQRWFESIRDYCGTEKDCLPEAPTGTPVLAEQPGVLAWLSTRRSWVRIPSRTLSETGTRSRHGTQTGKAAKLKPS
jgi:hypothetical protein